MGRSCSRLVVVVVVVSAVLVEAASARIVVYSGIAGVKIGESESSVLHHLGGPTSRVSDPGAGAGPPVKNGVQLEYAKRKLEVLLIKHTVAEVATSSVKERTAAGIGPGVSLKKVEQRYGKCLGNGYECFIPKVPKRTGDRYLAVEVDQRGRVIRLAVGRYRTGADEFCYLLGCG